MKTKRSLLLILGLIAGTIVDAETLRLIQTIPLPGVRGRIDHMAVDLDGQRLFIAAFGNDTVEVVDLQAGRRMRSLTGLRGPQGVAWIAERNALFVAAGEEKGCRVFDGKSFAATEVAGPIADADNVRVDANAHRVYVGCGRGALRAVNVTNWSVAGDIALPSHPEAFRLEKQGPRIFVNLPASRRVMVLNRAQLQVADSWTLTSAGGNFPLALDEEGRRLFVGCRTPPRMIVLNSHTGREVGGTAMDGDCDDIFYDAPHHSLYASCGDGFVDVLDVRDLKLVERIATAAGARTSLFVPALQRLFVAVPRRGDQSAEIRVLAVSDEAPR